MFRIGLVPHLLSTYSYTVNFYNNPNNLRRPNNQATINVDGFDIEFEEVAAYAQENNLLHFEVSAKTGANIKELFTEIAIKIPKTSPLETRSAFPIAPPRHRRRDAFSCW